MTIDELTHRLRVSPEDIMTETSMMEITGLIRREAGNVFALVNQ